MHVFVSCLWAAHCFYRKTLTQGLTNFLHRQATSLLFLVKQVHFLAVSVRVCDVLCLCVCQKKITYSSEILASEYRWASSLINLWPFRHTPWICNFIKSLISWVHSFTESDLYGTDNIAPFENTTPINLINLLLLCVLLFWPFYLD